MLFKPAEREYHKGEVGVKVLFDFGYYSAISALPHGNLPYSSSSRHFPSTPHWSLLQEHNFARLLWSRRRAWGRVIRKRKIFHEASLP
jgi:hypothetical protein